MNVISKNSVDQSVATIIEQYGKVDILANNTSISVSTKILVISEDAWNQVLDVNLKVVFHCTQNCFRDNNYWTKKILKGFNKIQLNFSLVN